MWVDFLTCCLAVLENSTNFTELVFFDCQISLYPDQKASILLTNLSFPISDEVHAIRTNIHICLKSSLSLEICILNVFARASKYIFGNTV